jgi:hypothetical protein
MRAQEIDEEYEELDERPVIGKLFITAEATQPKGIFKSLLMGNDYFEGVLRLVMTTPDGRTEEVGNQGFSIFGGVPVHDLMGDNLKRGLEALKEIEAEVEYLGKLGGEPWQLGSQGPFWFQREYAREWPAFEYPYWRQWWDRQKPEILKGTIG